MLLKGCLPTLAACIVSVCGGMLLADASDEGQPSGPKSVSIGGVSKVTIGLPYAFSCQSECKPNPCVFTFSHDGNSYHSQELDIVFKKITPTKVITCEARNPVTGATATAKKILQVAAGPQNVSVSAPEFLVNGIQSTFRCATFCYPSCSYTWYVNSQVWYNMGQELNFTSQFKDKVTVRCEPINILTHLFVSSSKISIIVAHNPKTISIIGASSVMAGETDTYLCSATPYCIPACNVTWHLHGETFTGNPLTVPILEEMIPKTLSKLSIQFESSQTKVPLTCTFTNTLTGKNASSTLIILVTDPISVNPIPSGPPIANSQYGLRCEGVKEPFSISWTKNGKSLSPSSTVHFSKDSTIISFEPLQQDDTGLYTCIVKEGEEDIPASYSLNVFYGPENVKLTLTGNRTVGQTVFLPQGKLATFFLHAECYPPCKYQWIFNESPVGNNESFSIKPTSTADEGRLSCLVYNEKTSHYKIVSTTIRLTVGPKEVSISGPSSAQVGKKATFECSAMCTPPCTYTWEVYGRTLNGRKVELTINHYVATETLQCIALNPASGQIAIANGTLDVTDPDWCGC